MPTPITASTLSALLSAALGIGLIAFINLRLIETVDMSLAVLPEFGLSLYQQPSGNDLRAGVLPALAGATQVPIAETA